ncbi:hypothetical protein [Nocardia caishijiensis]|uniref:Uncharacterized protein n=1 Tax=Nocardia caishijiensis TaxID=184756 RepID=A0ABQ6YIA6_9NOCA|nr:hypothetical protein [Nocardia caishijiensis]KAF0845528.1 hypothetical protein FNL39_107129 [Nocardia caishijiensis]
MSDDHRGDPRPPRRHGTTWRESEYRVLADDLRAGVDLTRTAHTLGRTESAIRTALRNFVPPEDRVSTAERERWVRTRLVAEPEWDWWAVVIDAHRRSGSRLWFTQHEHCARIGWRRRTPMPALAQELDTSELSAAELLRSLGLVESIEEAAERLGATPGHALADRVAARRDRAVGARWILVVDGAAGTTHPRNAPTRRHISLHETRAAAEAERDRVLAWHQRLTSSARHGAPDEPAPGPSVPELLGPRSAAPAGNNSDAPSAHPRGGPGDTSDPGEPLWSQERPRARSDTAAASGVREPALSGEQVWWTIAERGLGASTGPTRCGEFAAPTTGGEIAAEALAVGDIIRVPVPDGFLQDRITAITRTGSGTPITVDLAPVANSRIRRVVEFAPQERVEVVRGTEQRSA